MSFAKFPTSNAEGRKSDDGIDSLNTLVRQSIGREPFLSFPRSTESPVQWLQLLHGLDPDSAGWPLLPVNVPMQKCEKCNGEYYSPINYRRHMRVHHRLKKLDKDDLKNRELLRLFWDKLSADEAKEIVSLKNTTLEGLPGATVVKELASLTRKPGIPSLPHFCIKAGSALLDIVQARPSRFPPSSQELFGVLDDASEKTFLCGSAISMQKYIFDGGEAAKIGLDTKNLVAFTSFLLEQRLVEAWIADKDAEALRCQKLLVEEEEAAKRRQAEISEKKRRKKLRQKEQKAKEQKNEEEGGFSVEEAEPLTDTSVHLDALDSESNDNLDQASSPEIPQVHDVEDAESESHPTEMDSVRDDDSNIHPRTEPRRINHNPRPFWQQNPSFATNGSRGYSAWKHEHRNWHGPNKKVWSRKVKPENGEESLKVVREQKETLLVQAEQDSRHEVLIGSIAVSLGSTEVRDDSDASGGRGSDHTLPKIESHEEVRDNVSLKSGDGEAGVALNDDNYSSEKTDIDSLSKESKFPFSGEAARAFLAQRWKEAMASDHVTLLLSPPPNRPFSDHHSGGRSTPGVSESRVGRGAGAAGLKKKYIAKQKDGT